MKKNLLILNALLQHKNLHKIALEHHIEGIIYHQFKNNNPKFQDQYKKQWVHNQILQDELHSISLKLQGTPLTATLLKGAHLLQDLYPDLGSRFLSDIDLLIEEKDYLYWEKTLQDFGYKHLSLATFSGNNYKFQWSKFREDIEINIELHTKLFFHLKKENWILKSSALLPFTKLSLEDTLIHLCGHLAFQHSFLKLYWLFDIYFYIDKFGDQINWDEVVYKSKNAHLYQSVLMCLWCMEKYFYLSPKIALTFNTAGPKWWQKFLTINFLLNPDKNKIDYFLIKHATKDYLWEAIWYDLIWLWHYKIQNKF